MSATEPEATLADPSGPDEVGLFDYEAPPAISLADKFGVPPLSVLDRRSGPWQDRKRAWLSMGIKSEVGRDGSLAYGSKTGTDPVSLKLAAISGGTSVFDPVLCELAYRWHTAEGDRVLDPFAGGSVRGITASILSRRYTGIDLRGEQVVANRQQVHLCGPMTPRWIEGDSANMGELLYADHALYDFVFSCPPYGDLEHYSDHPDDLSNMTDADFDATHAEIITRACERLARDRFAVWVISDVRDKRGAYRGLVADTIRAFRDAGLSFHNDAVMVDMVGTASIRAERPFRATRKLTRVHQHMLVFVKGNASDATRRLAEAPLGMTPSRHESSVSACENCGNDDPTEGYSVCSDCLEGDP